MNVRVRFAPSPTGYLHIGGARTALYNYLYAKSMGGQFILRIEDTDLERSSREYELLQIEDLKWLGIEYDIGPGKEDEFGPYRQSERLQIYQEYANKLIIAGKAYYDFSTAEELEQMKQEALDASGDPRYTGKWREEKNWPEAAKRIEQGETAAIRFKSTEKEYSFKDLVRDEVTFPKDMVGDFVIMRSNGLPTYNYCNVIDDHLHAISHVLRGEEHLNNTVRQLMLYEAFSWEAPQYAHLSLLIGKDRQKLSKRHGSTSVHLYKQEHYLPEALKNYICLLGWSHPEERDIFKMSELEKIFNLNRFSKAPAIYDMEKLKYINGQHLKSLSEEEFFALIEDSIPANHFFHDQDLQWKKTCLALFKEKMDLSSEFVGLLKEHIENIEIVNLNEESQNIMNLPEMEAYSSAWKNFLENKNLTSTYLSKEEVSKMMEEGKKTYSLKGKNLFMGTRLLLTLQDHGPDLITLISLTKISTIIQRLKIWKKA